MYLLHNLATALLNVEMGYIMLTTYSIFAQRKVEYLKTRKVPVKYLDNHFVNNMITNYVI